LSRGARISFSKVLVTFICAGLPAQGLAFIVVADGRVVELVAPKDQAGDLAMIYEIKDAGPCCFVRVRVVQIEYGYPDLRGHFVWGISVDW
jgi:hypothetical protein